MIYKLSTEVNNTIFELLFSDNPLEVFRNKKDMPEIKKFKLIVLDTNLPNNIPELSFKYNKNNYFILPLGKYENAFLLNFNSVISNQTFELVKINRYVNLDSNIISSISKCLSSKKKMDNNLLDLIQYLKSKETSINISSLPYFLEDSLNKNGMKNQLKAYECMLYYSVFLNCSFKQIQSLEYSLQAEDYIYADEVFSKMIQNKKTIECFEPKADVIYCLLLKIYIIHFTSKKNADKKISQLLNFINKELGIYNEYLFVLAYKFFNGNHTAKEFFQKVQCSSKEKLKDIEGMAWDLFNVINLPLEMAILSKMYNFYSLGYFATHDIKLAELIKSNPIKRLVFFEEYVEFRHQDDLFSLSNGYEIYKELCANQENRKTIFSYENTKNLISSLEKELLSLFEIK